MNVAWAARNRVKYDATSPNIFLRLRIVEAGHATLVDFVLTWYFIIYAHDMEVFSFGDKFYRLDPVPDKNFIVPLTTNNLSRRCMHKKEQSINGLDRICFKYSLGDVLVSFLMYV